MPDMDRLPPPPLSMSLDEIEMPNFSEEASKDDEFDLVIIGSGPAGQKAAISAAKAGARVAVVERDPMAGGVCLNTGTVPSKTLREAVVYLTGYRQRGYYGESFRQNKKVTAADLVGRTNIVISLERELINEVLASNGVERFVGSGRVSGEHVVSVDLAGSETKVKARNVLVATGTIPRRPADIPFDDVNIFDSDAVFGTANELRPLPDSIIVVGAGIIGIEYASMFVALGIETHVIDSRPDPMGFVDKEISEVFYSQLRGRGVRAHYGVNYSKVEIIGPAGQPGSRVRCTLENGEVIEVDSLLFAMGRVPCTKGLGLEGVGVVLGKRGHMEVDDRYRSNIKWIFGAGDVIGFPSLASTSAEQGRVAALTAIGRDVTWRPDLLPYGIYTIPEISYVGKTEEEAKKENIPYFVGTALWSETARGKIIGDLGGALKMIFHRETHKLLGVHVIGEGATELLHIGQGVMHFGGGPEYFTNAVFNYPTLAEAYKIAAFNALNRLGGRAHSIKPLHEQVAEGGSIEEWSKWCV